MLRCEDYPYHGDGGGCPDSRGRFRCVSCGRTMRAGATSALCDRCRRPKTCRACGQTSVAGSCGCFDD